MYTNLTSDSHLHVRNLKFLQLIWTKV